jgi:hypothetical protein
MVFECGVAFQSSFEGRAHEPLCDGVPKNLETPKGLFLTAQRRETPRSGL